MSSTRLTAPERRKAVLEAACGAFSCASYRGATTAEIARAAGVSEPILYRHFGSKRELFLACLDSTWDALREAWELAIAGEPDPAHWLSVMGSAVMELHAAKVQLTDLWVEALSEASDDAVIQEHLRAHFQRVHDHVADVVRRAQEAGAVVPDRDPTAEAWIFVALGLLGSIGRRVGGLAGEDFPRIIASRREWMTGRNSDPATS